MPGWRVGFMVGNKTLVAALARIKSYLDYGMFTPIQVAAIAALEGPQDCVREIARCTACAATCCATGSTRWLAGREAEGDDVRLGADPGAVPPGLARVLQEAAREAKVAVSPGIGFGEYGDDHVRFGLIENEHRTRQALRGIKEMFRRDGACRAEHCGSRLRQIEET
jgi:alanine-synthesizing transaminase